MKRKFLLWYKKRKFNKVIKKCKGLCAGCRYKKPCSEEREQDMITKVLEENIMLHEQVKTLSKLTDEYEERLFELQTDVAIVKRNMDKIKL